MKLIFIDEFFEVISCLLLIFMIKLVFMMVKFVIRIFLNNDFFSFNLLNMVIKI